MALPIAFGQMSKKELAALKTVKIDPDKARKISDDRYEIPSSAVPEQASGSPGDLVMVRQDDNWYLTE